MWLILPYKIRRKKRYPTTVAWKVISDVVGGAGVSHLEDWFHLSKSLLLLGSISQPLANRSPGLKTTPFIRKPFGSQHSRYLHACTISATFLKLEDQNTASAILIRDSPNKQTTTAMTSWLDSLPTSVDPDDKEMKRSPKLFCWFWRIFWLQTTWAHATQAM